MGKYAVKIGETVYSREIQDSTDWKLSFLREFSEKVIRVSSDYVFTGWYELHEFLYNKLVIEGVCVSSEADVYYQSDKSQPWKHIWRGEIKPQDFKVDLIKNSTEGQILEPIWAARFNNSSEQKIFLRSSTTRDGSATLPIPLQELTVYDALDPAEANYLTNEPVLGFRVYDVLKFMINYYTNGTAQFVSNYFEPGGDGWKYCITTGYELRVRAGLTSNPQISWKELFDNLNKLFNLWVLIEGTLDEPIVRIETAEYAFSEEIMHEVSNPEAIELGFNLDQMYTELEVGSDTTEYDPGNNADYPPGYYFLSWSDAEFNSTGDCEFENSTLDLKVNIKIDHNSIQRSIADIDDTLDDDIMLIAVDDANFAIKYQDRVTNAGILFWLYNKELQNEFVVFRWFDTIPSIVATNLTKDYYSAVQDPATVAASTIDVSPPATGQGWLTIVSDADNLFQNIPEPFPPGTISGTWTAPVAANYRIECTCYVAIPVAGPFDVGAITMAVGVYTDNTFTVPITKFKSPLVPSGYIGSLSVDETIFLQAGWVARIEWNPVFFGTIFVESGSASFSTPGANFVATNERPYVYEYTIENWILSVSDWDKIVENNTKRIRFLDTKQKRHYDLWPLVIEYSHDKQYVETSKFVGRPPIAEPSCWVLDGANGLAFWDDDCYWFDSKSWIDTP